MTNGRSTETRLVSKTGGAKGSKLEQYSLIPPGPLEELARLYGTGALKYDRHNWKRGYRWSLSYDALMRHLEAFRMGESFDPETDCHHMACVAFHAFALQYFEEEHADYDDLRESKQPPF